MNLEKICKEVIEVSLRAGDKIKAEVNKLTPDNIESKGLHNYVTYVDRMAEKMITSELRKLIPDAGFIVEEDTISKKGTEYYWVVDPLDGTTNFIHRLPVYATSIALMRNQEVIIGVVYEINNRECFYAWQESHAFLNGNVIHVSGIPTLHDALLATGFPYTDYGRMNHYLDLLGHLLKNSSGLRRYGSAAVDLCYVACGRFDGFYEYGLNPWDVAAGSLILQQAQGQVSDFRGKNEYIFNQEIIATNGLIHNQLSEALKNYFVISD